MVKNWGDLIVIFYLGIFVCVMGNIAGILHRKDSKVVGYFGLFF
jgi:hypothetical protein